jgi:hypothetical protein
MPDESGGAVASAANQGSTARAVEPAPDRRRRDEWSEVILVFALSVTVVASAWGGFQATKWSGVQANSYSAANASRSESLKQSNLAGQQTVIDVTLFTSWVQAKASGDDQLASFLQARFRPEFVPAFESWLALQPLTNASAPPSPFAMTDYQLAATDQANQLEDQAAKSGATARTANQTGDQYVFATLVLALVLFFGALSQKFQASQSAIVLEGLAVVSLIGALGILAVLPRTFG